MNNLYMKIDAENQTVSTWTSERETPIVKDLSNLSKQEFIQLIEKCDEYMSKFEEVILIK